MRRHAVAPCCCYSALQSTTKPSTTACCATCICLRIGIAVVVEGFPAVCGMCRLLRVNLQTQELAKSTLTKFDLQSVSIMLVN